MHPRHVRAAAKQAVRDLVDQRLSLLGPRERLVVECAALLGYRVEVKLLARCLSLELDTMRRTLRDAFELDLIVSDASHFEHVRFRHALTQAAVRASMGNERARQMHAAIACALEGLPDAAARVEQIAHHRSLAGERDAVHRDGVAAQGVST